MFKIGRFKTMFTSQSVLPTLAVLVALGSASSLHAELPSHYRFKLVGSVSARTHDGFFGESLNDMGAVAGIEADRLLVNGELRERFRAAVVNLETEEKTILGDIAGPTASTAETISNSGMILGSSNSADPTLNPSPVRLSLREGSLSIEGDYLTGLDDFDPQVVAMNSLGVAVGVRNGRDGHDSAAIFTQISTIPQSRG